MIKRGRGRPINQKKLITLDQAVETIKEELRKRYGDEAIVQKLSYKKGTLYNLISLKHINRYGPTHCALVDKEEILTKLVG